MRTILKHSSDIGRRILHHGLARMSEALGGGGEAGM
jgi:hypothetical protein